MSQLRCFSLVGDSNVRRNLSSTNTRGRAPMSNAQFIPCGRLSTFSESLASVRSESDACIVSCVSNFLSNSISRSQSTSLRVDTVLTSFFDKLIDFCRSRTSLAVLLCSPMYRTTPLWYRDGLSEIMVKFNALYVDRVKTSGVINLHLLPSFATQQLEDDGVHLTPYAGSEFILHLFESSEDVVKTLKLDPAARVTSLSCETRSLEDRVMVLERDHARLNQKFEHQSAVHAELLDFEENIRNEDFMMIQGIPALPRLSTGEWQIKARQSVDAIFSILGFDCNCLYVQNTTGRGKDARTLYKVRVATAELSRDIRNKFGSFFSGGQDTRPESLKSISIRNCVTQATLGRVAIMQLLAKRYRDSNPGSRAQVIAYEPRPLLKITPPPEASDRRLMTFNYVEAITKLPTAFSSSEIEALLKRLSPSLFGNLRSVLGVIDDDMLKKKRGPGSKRGPTGAESAPDVTDANSSSESSEFRTPDESHGRKRPRTTARSGPSAKQ